MDFNFFDTDVDLSRPAATASVKTEVKNDETVQVQGQQNQAAQAAQENTQEVQVVDTIKDVWGDTKPAAKAADTTGDATTTEEVKETKEIKESPSETTSADTSSLPYSTFAKALAEEGVITGFEEGEFEQLVKDMGPVEALIELNKRTIADQVDAYKNSLTAEQRDVLEAIEQGVPLDQYLQSKAKAASYASIDEEQLGENEDLQKNLIRNFLYSKGYKKEEVEEELKDIDALGKLETKAKTALNSLKTYEQESLKRQKEEAAAAKRAAQEETKKQLTTLKTTIDGVKEIVPGVQINSQTKGKLYDIITQPAGQTPNGQALNAIWLKRSENPMDFDIKMAYLYSIGVFDGKWDKIVQGAKSGAVKDLTEKLQGGSVTRTGDAVTPETTQSAKDILKSMNVFRKQ